jgi:GT2 family glycosyltransferase
MALKRRVFDDVGMFDPMFGPGRVACCEDIDLVYRAQRKGLKFMYLPEMLVYHNHGRRTDDDVRRIQRQYIAGHGAFYAKHVLRGDHVAFELGVRESFSTLGSTVRVYARRRDYLRKLSWFVQGFLYGLVASCRTLGSGPRKPQKG